MGKSCFFQITAPLVLVLTMGFVVGAPAQDISGFDSTAEGPWSDIKLTTLQVPKVVNNSIKLDSSPSSAEYGNFKGIKVVPGDNGWILDFPDDRATMWTGSADSSFTFYLAYDDNFLYVGVEALDDLVVSDNPNAEFWNDDAIEMVVDALNDRYDNNTDTSNDLYGGHCYVNYKGRFSRWDDSTDSLNPGIWATGLEWTYAENGDIYGVGSAVTGGWKMEVKLHKKLFEDPTVGNKIVAGYKMGFNIGMDDDDMTGPNAGGSRAQDLEIQYFWANRLRAKGWTADEAAMYDEVYIKNQQFMNDYELFIDSTGRLSHGGTGEIVFGQPAAVPNWCLY